MEGSLILKSCSRTLRRGWFQCHLLVRTKFRSLGNIWAYNVQLCTARAELVSFTRMCVDEKFMIVFVQLSVQFQAICFYSCTWNGSRTPFNLSKGIQLSIETYHLNVPRFLVSSYFIQYFRQQQLCYYKYFFIGLFTPISYLKIQRPSQSPG